MRKIALAMALLFCADLAYDSFDSDCFVGGEQPCHACLCQTPTLSPATSKPEKIEAPKAVLIAPDRETVADRLTDKSFFQPPKTLV